LIRALLVAGPSFADQTAMPNYRAARDQYVYNEVYPNGGFTLYCGVRWEERSSMLNVEHVLPASWMKATAGCAGHSREECRDMSERFNHMEADLHNLYPALASTNRARSNYTFAIIGEDDEEPVFGDCDFEVDRDGDRVEPRRIARGDIARGVFYMSDAYGVPLQEDVCTLLKEWNRDDPPSDWERYRNDVIANLQGTRNPYIDDSRLVDSVSCQTTREECRIKGNINSRGERIYHMPESPAYHATKINEDRGERWFCSADEAEAAGWRAPRW